MITPIEHNAEQAAEPMDEALANAIRQAHKRSAMVNDITKGAVLGSATVIPFGALLTWGLSTVIPLLNRDLGVVDAKTVMEAAVDVTGIMLCAKIGMEYNRDKREIAELKSDLSAVHNQIRRSGGRITVNPVRLNRASVGHFRAEPSGYRAKLESLEQNSKFSAALGGVAGGGVIFGLLSLIPQSMQDPDASASPEVFIRVMIWSVIIAGICAMGYEAVPEAQRNRLLAESDLMHARETMQKWNAIQSRSYVEAIAPNAEPAKEISR